MRRSAAEKSIEDLLDRYSPSKSVLLSSPPPAFGRMALPIGMPSTASASSNPPRQTHRKKPSLKDNFAKVDAPRVKEAPTEPKDSVAQHGKGTEMGKEKKQLDEDRKRAALERIAARRLKASKAV